MFPQIMRRSFLVLPLSILFATAAHAQVAVSEPPFLTNSGWIIARGHGYASDNHSFTQATVQLFGVRGTPYTGKVPAGGYAKVHPQASIRCIPGRGTYFTETCVFDYASGRPGYEVCRRSANRIIAC